MNEERGSTPPTHAFGPYTISEGERVLRRNGSPIVVAAKAIDCLVILAANRDRVISKHELIERLWPSVYIDEANLTQTVYILRRTFKQHQSGVTIENIPKRGYRLIVERQLPESRPKARVRAANLAAAIVAVAVSVGLLSFVHRLQPSREPLSGTALSDYMLARADQDGDTPADLRRSSALYARVARTRPDSSLGYAGMAECDASLSFYARTTTQRIHLQAAALTLAQQAVETDPSADAYAARGGVELSVEHDDAAAATDFQRSLAMNPNQLHALLWYGSLLMNHGDVGAARRLFERGIGLAPNSADTAVSLAWNDFVARDYAGAIALSKQMVLSRQFPSLARITLANAYLATGNLGAARRTIRDLSADPASRYQAIALLAELQVLTGHAAMASEALHRVDDTTDRRTTDGWDAASIAAAYVALGERSRAFMWLSRVDVRERGQVATDPRFHSLRNDPQFQAWLGG